MAQNLTLLVVSDIHGNSLNLARVLARQIKTPDALLFLGDGCSDINRAEPFDMPLFAVRGNCDMWSLIGMQELTRDLTVTLGGYKIFLTHGHAYINSGGVDAIAARGAREGADVVLYGHTHVRYEAHYAAGDTVGGVRLEKALHVFNPGSLGSPRDGKAPAFGVIEIRENGILFSHGEV